jgi:hypothetical protein
VLRNVGARIRRSLSAEEEVEESALGVRISKEIGPVLRAGRYDQSLVARLHRSVQLTGVASEGHVLPADEKKRSNAEAADRRESVKATELPWR